MVFKSDRQRKKVMATLKDKRVPKGISSDDREMARLIRQNFVEGEDAEDLRREYPKKVGSKIFVSDLNTDFKVLLDDSVKTVKASLVIEADGSIRWYINPSEDDMVIKRLSVSEKKASSKIYPREIYPFGR